MSNKFYTFVGTMDNAIYHRYYDENKNEVCEKVEEYDYTLYVEHHSDYSGYKSLLGKKLKEIHFETPADLSKFYRENKDMLRIHGNDSAVQQFIAKEYNYDVKQTCPVNILNFDLEIEHSKGFPDPHKAEQEIMSISVKKFGANEIMYSIGTKPLLEYDNPKGKYIQCKDEKEVIVQFLKKWKEINPQIITGWNCVPLTNNVWLNDKIVKMENVNVKTKLYNSFVEHVYPVSNKKVFETKLSNGIKTKSSKDHIYPINYIKKGKYITDINSLIHSDNTVEEIKDLSIDHDIYYKVNLGNNNNNDLTYRELIKNNYTLLKSKGLLFKLCDTILVKKISKIVEYASKEVHKSVEFWNDENIINLTSKKEFYEYLDRNTNIIIFNKDLNGVRNSININLDEVLSSDLMWFLGMWFTDGTSSYKSEVSICNKNYDVNERLYNISKNIFNSKQNKPNARKDECTYTNFGLSNVWFLKLFIYDSVMSKSNKQLNVELLSQLSRNQFLSFYAGCIDGDGSVKNNAILLSNYNDQLNEISELLLWNGIYNTICNNGVRTYINDEVFKNNLVIDYKKNSIDFSNDYQRTSKSNNLRWFFDNDNNCVYTKLESIIETDEYVDMIDISTNTHYFINNGIETHNCDNFDIPYLVNRIKNVFGKKALAHLSPFKDKVKNNDKLISERIVNDKIHYDIFGITSFDYIELYQKYNLSKQESYKLDYIGEVEIGQRKVNFDEYKKSLMNLYNGDITVDLKTPFNELDEIMKYARIREVVRRRLAQVGFSLDNDDKFLGDNVYRFELETFDFSTIKNADNETLKGLYNFCDERVRTLSYKKFVMYNEQDANIVELLDDKMKFIKQAIRVAHMSRSRFRDIFGTVAAWDNMIYARLLAKNIQIPPRESFEKDEKFTGAYVKDPILGFHKWIVSFDYKSLYPSLIRLLKMSPESLIKGQDDNRFDTLKKILHREYDTDKICEKGHGVAGNGSVFDQSIDGVLPETMKYLMEERDVVKDSMKQRKRNIEKMKGIINARREKKQ